MARQNDNVNLLPERERKEGEAALRRAATASESQEVRLVMPQVVKADDKKKKSWLARWQEKRAKAKEEKMKAKAAQSMKFSAPVEAKPPQAPLPDRAAKPVMSAPAPAAKPAMSKIEPKLVAPKPEKAAPAASMASKPAAAPKPEVKPQSMLEPRTRPAPKPEPVKIDAVAKPVKPQKKDDKKAKLHEPAADGGFMGPGVNLVPSDVVRAAQGTPWGLYAGILVAVLGVWVGVSGYSISRARSAEARVQELNARMTQVNTIIKDYESDKTVHVALQKQFTLVKGLVDGHIYWTPFLQKLEETTIPDVYYMGMNANRDGSVTLRAVAKNYASAARQIRAFERASTFVQSVQVNQARQDLQKGAALPVPVVEFDIQLKLVAGIFTVPVPENGAEQTP